MRRRIVILPGQYYDSETGLHYNWHRFYDPETGRYISADPIGLDGGTNLFAYVANNGVNLGDKLGLWIFKGACRYISGGEILGGGALRCMMWTECYKDAKGRGSIVQSAEVIATFVGLTAGLPGSITFFSIALDDGIYHGKPDINNLTGLSYLISASSALIGGVSWYEIKLGKGSSYDKVGDQVGIDASTDLFVGSSAIEGEIQLRCCDRMNEILEEADFLP